MTPVRRDALLCLIDVAHLLTFNHSNVLRELAGRLVLRHGIPFSPLLNPMLVPLLFVLSSVMTVYTSPLAVVIPLDRQLPLIARINQPFSWSFCSRTFGPDNGMLTYSTSSLPNWLSFDAATMTFHGTPSAEDEGNPKIMVTASDSSTSVYSTFSFCVTPFPPPTLKRSISEQFTASNTALSSVFVLAANSALTTGNPALRIPPRWSFSVGFMQDMFLAENDIYYEVRLSDGSPLPEWVFFNSKALTVNGITPNESTILSLALHVSDQEGYTASTLPFDLIISSHELSITTSSLPTINVTASTPFNVTLSSPADFSGVIGDAQPMQPSNITSLAIDVSGYNWLKYDNASRTLSGDPGEHGPSAGQNPRLPVTLTAYNQSIQTYVSLAMVPSYFLASSLPPIQAIPGSQIQFNLSSEYSNATSRDDVKLTAALEPADVVEWLLFDPETGRLTGNVPADFTSTHITATFTAYSRITHSTSHITLPIVVLSADRSRKSARPGSLSAAAHKKLVLGLNITFGVVGGLAIFGGLLAAFRRCARVEDTAAGGEEGRNVWSDQDKRWYGLEKVMSHQSSTESVPPRSTPDYGRLGLGLRRISERSQSEDINSPASKLRSPGVMSKREFITRIKETVRIVSDKAQGRKASRKRPIIGKPILRSSQQPPGIPLECTPVVDSPSDPFNRPGLPSHPGSTIMTNSPSTSTAEHSIPRRRADFAPPRSPAQAHLEDNRLSRPLSTGSTGSLASNASARTHAAEAVVQTASKAISIRSGKSSSGISHQSAISEPTQAVGTRPRLVPFTSAARVPVPRRPTSPGLDVGSSATRRVPSQTAKVWKSGSPQTGNSDEDVAKSGSGDELRMGVHYMQSLGEDHRVDYSILDASHVRSSVSSLVSSHQRNDSNKNVARALVRIGENFRFRVPVPPASPSTQVFEVKLTSGEAMPRFLHVDMGEVAKGAVELSGVPAATDVGEVVVGVYTSDGVCVSRMVLEVVKWR